MNTSILKAKPKWPRKQRLGDFAAQHFVSPKQELPRLRKQLKEGELPGVLEGGLWFVWVLPDGEPAYGYTPNSQPVKKETHIELPSTGNPIADAILIRKAHNIAGTARP